MSDSAIRFAIGSWNIGGGILGDSHQLNGTADLDYHIARVREWAPDILCLQEAHEYPDGRPGQAGTIAETVGYKYVHTVAISPSHLDSEANLSLSIISNYELSNPRYTQFPNPGFTSVGPNGEQWILFDKGYLTIDAMVGDAKIAVVDAHCFPLHYFGASARDDQFASMWSSFAGDLTMSANDSCPVVAAIDLNYEPIEDLIGEVFTDQIYTNAFTRTPTIPKGVQQDYIIYTGSVLRLEETSVTPTEADHHYCEARLVL